MPKEQRAMIRQFRSQAPRLHQLMGRCADVRLACGEVLKVLTDFRSEHLKVAVRYVVNPKNRGSLTCPVTGKMAGSAASPHNISTKSHGTGGTEMSKLLKAIRDATKQLAASAQVA
ncbi:hypothetical protein FRC02_004807 [Tulasnella sp. 418]|nr:hypothetical protein FRC02_004807 [Tulasnella sp. 418]